MIWIALKTLATLILAFAAAGAYRAGGSANFHARWMRQAGIMFTVPLTIGIWFGFNWWLLGCCLISWAESTYFKKKGTDAHWWNWLLVGVVFAIVPLPWVIANGHHWLGFFIRSAVLLVFTPLWCIFQGDANTSETGRGAAQILTLPLLLL